MIENVVTEKETHGSPLVHSLFPQICTALYVTTGPKAWNEAIQTKKCVCL